MSAKDKPVLTDKAQARAKEKEERLAKALRENLRKRKAATQARQDQTPGQKKNHP